MFIPELCTIVYLHLWSFALWLWCIYLIAFNKSNIIHKETLKQEI